LCFRTYSNLFLVAPLNRFTFVRRLSEDTPHLPLPPTRCTGGVGIGDFASRGRWDARLIQAANDCADPKSVFNIPGEDHAHHSRLRFVDYAYSLGMTTTIPIQLSPMVVDFAVLDSCQFSS